MSDPGAPERDPLLDYAELVTTQAAVFGSPVLGMYELLHAQVLDPSSRVAPFDEFHHTTTLASAATSFIPAPNNDTVYSRAWLDLRSGPVVLDVPDTGDRYYTIQVLDLFSETVDNLGTRLYGNRAGSFVFVGPGWTGELPAEQRAVRCSTPFVLAFMRILVNGEADLPNVVALQQRFRLVRPSNGIGSQVGTAHDELPAYDVASPRASLQTLRAVLALAPCPAGSEAVVAGFGRVGADPSQPADVLGTLPDDVLERGFARARRVVDAAGLRFGTAVHGWRVAREGVGTYGFDYLQRAVVWSKGALANVPEESLYPSAFLDGDGQPLDGGTHRYELRFPAGGLPPALQFWSITMYLFRNGFLVDNPLDRYSLGDRSLGLVTADDGSLTLYLQHESPGPEREANWLPAPAEPFYVSMRLYGPSPAAVTGEWEPPPITRVG